MTIIKDPGFLWLMKMGRPHMKVLKGQTVNRDVHTVFKRYKGKIVDLLKNYDGRLNFATDCWTSPNHRPFMAVMVTFEKNGEVVTMLLDVVEVATNHTGVNLAGAFANILEEFGIADKLLSITCNSASANDVMIEELTKILARYPGPKNRVRCFAHIINLIVKIILRQFDSRVRLDTTGATVSFDDLEFGDDNEGVQDDGGESTTVELTEEELAAVEERLKDELGELGEKVKPIQTVLTKLCKLSNAIKNSPTINLPRWKKIIVEVAASEDGKYAHLKVCMMPHDVPTRWNSTFDMLDFVLTYQDVDLQDYVLSKKDWLIVRELKNSLKMFKKLTLLFLKENASLASVIPAMDLIDEKLASASINENLSAPIRAALTLGKKLLNKYYSLTDSADVYRIAMVLDPSRKLKYFKDAGWEPEWIKKATKIVKNEFMLRYESYCPPTEALEEHDEDSDSTGSDFSFNLSRRRKPYQSNGEVEDELERYLKAPCVNTRDALQWWFENHHVYPRLFWMARDYLSIPATSVSVERLFSQGRLLLSHIRNRMSAETTCSLLCVGAWSLMGIVTNEDMLAAAHLPDVNDNDIIEVD